MELRKTELALSSYLKEEFAKLLSIPSFYEWIDSHVEHGPSRSTKRIMDALAAWVQEELKVFLFFGFSTKGNTREHRGFLGNLWLIKK